MLVFVITDEFRNLVSSVEQTENGPDNDRN